MHTILVVGYSTRWHMFGWQNLADGTKTQPVTGHFWKSLINWFHFINLINLGIVFNLTLPALKEPPSNKPAHDQAFPTLMTRHKSRVLWSVSLL